MDMDWKNQLDGISNSIVFIDEGATYISCLLYTSQENSDFRLLPYRAVGVSSGMLLCFTADNVRIGDTDYGPITVALSPTPVSDGGGYTALWGASKGRTGHAA